MNNTTCCFTGHRNLPQRKIKQIKKRLDKEIDKLYHQGITNFISSGAPGFAQMAASSIIAKKAKGYNIRLTFILPCKSHDSVWPDVHKQLFHSLLMEADEVQFTSEEYHDNCMKERILYMLEQSDYLICALKRKKLEKPEYIFDYTQANGLQVINLIE